MSAPAIPLGGQSTTDAQEFRAAEGLYSRDDHVATDAHGTSVVAGPDPATTDHMSDVAQVRVVGGGGPNPHPDQDYFDRQIDDVGVGPNVPDPATVAPMPNVAPPGPAHLNTRNGHTSTEDQKTSAVAAPTPRPASPRTTPNIWSPAGVPTDSGNDQGQDGAQSPCVVAAPAPPVPATEEPAPREVPLVLAVPTQPGPAKYASTPSSRTPARAAQPPRKEIP